MKDIFERVEKKYTLTEEKYEKIFSEVQKYASVDKYGLQTVSNIYYDTDTFALIINSIQKPAYKEKLRLRCYGEPKKDGAAFVELKKKYEGIVYKRRVSGTLEQCENYLKEGTHFLINQTVREIDYFIGFYKPSPKLFLAYDRVALSSKDGLRITFDNNLRSRTDELSMTNGSYGEKLFSENIYVMEIKAPCAMPLWLVKVLSDNKIYPTGFSKYGKIYQQILSEKNNRGGILYV